MLRIEHLGNRMHELAQVNQPESHQSALWTLFELYDLLGNRADIKNELLQELDRQRLQLIRYSGQPGVSEEQLAILVKEIAKSHSSLSAVPIRLGSHIPEFEWLSILRGRSGVPGGTCQFDIPSFSPRLQFWSIILPYSCIVGNLLNFCFISNKLFFICILYFSEDTLFFSNLWSR